MAHNTIINLDELTKRELEIMKYIHENVNDVHSMSIQELSNQVNYSTSTILRLCKKLGFRGFPELKYFLRTTYAQETGIALKDEKKDLNKVLHYLSNDIEGTAAFINNDIMPSICKLLMSDYPIYLYKPGGLTDVCVDYLERLLFISQRPKVYKLTSTRIARHMIQNADEHSIFIFISLSGSYSNTVRLAREAKIQGMNVIAITSTEDNTLSDLSNYSLRFFAKKKENDGVDTSSRIPAFFAISSVIECYTALKNGGQ